MHSSLKTIFFHRKCRQATSCRTFVDVSQYKNHNKKWCVLLTVPFRTGQFQKLLWFFIFTKNIISRKLQLFVKWCVSLYVYLCVYIKHPVSWRIFLMKILNTKINSFQISPKIVNPLPIPPNDVPSDVFPTDNSKLSSLYLLIFI